jgi:hypothetical protein
MNGRLLAPAGSRSASRPLGLDARAGKSEALAAMAGAALARGRLTGTYERE